MNILPLICSLLLVFALISTTFIQDQKSLSLIEWSLTSAFRTERVLRNRIESRHYRKQKATAAKPPSPQPVADPSVHRSFISYRSLNPPTVFSKLNVAPLLESPREIRNDPLYLTGIKLIDTLYKDCPFFQKHRDPELAKRIFDAMLAKAKALKKVEGLSDLFPDDPILGEVYYKMLKGTNHYEIEGKKGIPPLHAFLACQEEKKENAIYFHFASLPLLEALFGAQVAQEIVTMEKKLWEQKGQLFLFDRNALSSLAPSSQQVLMELEPYLNFTRRIPAKKNIAATDRQTGLTLQRKC